jgi:hypothetical protein
MIRQSLVSGLIAGLVLVLAVLFPAFSLLIYPTAFGLRWPPMPDLVRSLLLMGCAALGTVALVGVGSLAAIRVRASDVIEGLRAGTISGLSVGLVLYVVLVSPTAGLAASLKLWAFEPTLLMPLPANNMVFYYLRDLLWSFPNELVLALLAGALVGGIEGALVGRLRPRVTQESSTLLALVTDRRGHRRWFAGNEDALRIGILVGLGAGLLLGLIVLANWMADLQAQWLELRTAMEQGQVSQVLDLQVGGLISHLLSPLAILVTVGAGVLVVWLIKDPPRRYLSRLHGAAVAAAMMGLVVAVCSYQIVRVYVGLSHYFWFGEVLQLTPAEALSGLSVVEMPYVPLILNYLAPPVIVGLCVAVAAAWVVPQAAIYTTVLAQFLRRPADRAAAIQRRLASDPEALFPHLYHLFDQDREAVQVLTHLAFQLARSDPRKALLVSAYHTLLRHGEQVPRALQTVRQVLARQTSWHWQRAISELYRVLDEGMGAQTLEQVATIAPLPEELPSSLPPFLSLVSEGLGRVLVELKKIERVEDLNAKLSFFNSVQDAILSLLRYTDFSVKASQGYATRYPEAEVVRVLLGQWQEWVLEAARTLQGRADLWVAIKVRQMAFAPRLRQCVLVTNRGLNVAQYVRVRVADGEGYRVLDGAEQQVEILSPQETREFEFVLAPRAAVPLRLEWQITYDDAVDQDRRLTFADQITFDEMGKPFERIFPIPYVTGTPLRSGEMFVGRQDVFDFVRQHLLGRYQNNVIVLHGQRRTGKTSILYRLQEVLAESHLAVLIDMQGKAARGMADFLYTVADDVAYALEGHGIRVQLPERLEFEATPEHVFRAWFVRDVVPALDKAAPAAWRDNGGARNVLLMFDEFEELQGRVEDGRLDAGVFPYLRNLMQHEPRLDFIFSGTHKLEELGAAYWSILFNIAAYKRITFLNPDDVRRLIAEPVSPYGMEYDPLAIDRILQVTAGHPYFAQVVCHEMVAYHNETERSYMTMACVDQVLDRIIERGEAHFKYIWAEATRAERQVLLSLTDLLPDPDAGATPDRISTDLARRGYPLTSDALQHVLATLLAKDTLARSSPHSRLYRFKIDLLRRWVGQTRPAVAA